MHRSMFIALTAASLFSTAPALAQTSRAGNNTPEDQAIADRLRFQGSKCDAPACRNNPASTYPESTRPGISSTTPSIAGGGQPNAR